MGGYGRALENLFDVLSDPDPPASLDALSSAVQNKLLGHSSKWLSSPDVARVREPLLEAIIARRPFSASTDIVAWSISVDDVCSLGLVQWLGSEAVPDPLVAPFILLQMLKHKLRPEGPLFRLCLVSATAPSRLHRGLDTAGRTSRSSWPPFGL